MAPFPEVRRFVVADLADEEPGGGLGAAQRRGADRAWPAPSRPATSGPARTPCRLDRVRLALVAGTPHTVARDAAMVRTRPAGAIAAYAALRGEAIVEHAGGRLVVRPGQAPAVRRGPTAGAGLRPRPGGAWRSRSRARTSPSLTGLDTVAAPLVLDAAGADSDPHARALVRLVGRAVAAEVPVPADERAVLESVSVLATGQRGSLPVAHRAAARAFIDDHLTDPGLCAADVAAGAGISERHLSRVLADAGTSVPRLVLARRLDLARSLLAAGTTERTADVAARCGFTSASHFSQAFRRRFGVSAGEVRASGHS
ncbi:helix-turn-helix domain-containing protein [Nocardioides convexus]|uniref:helix-turn-helix domain-containing protein n=1 Tax=Nocardioides convexus TaxID=2712224 RepID=UPI002418B3DB|nr:helix-turn-helix domain-containing protein [Nocardioides convexus]